MLCRRFLAPIVFCVQFLFQASGEEVFPLFVFQNGVRLDSHEKRAELLAELGYDGIGSASFPDGDDFEAVFSPYESRGLKVFSFYTGGSIDEKGGKPAPGLYEAIPKLKDRDVILELYLQGDRARNLDQPAVEWIREVAGRAKEANLEVILYPHAGFYIETIGDAVRIARKVDRENVGVMFNLCHSLRIEPGADLEAKLEEARPFLRQVSLSGADEGGKDWQSLIQPLGQGTYDVGRVIRILRELDFQGSVGVQCYNLQGAPEVFLRQSIEAWRKFGE